MEESDLCNTYLNGKKIAWLSILFAVMVVPFYIMLCWLR